MTRVRNPKNPDHKYFDAHLINELDAKSESYEHFVAAYSAYVLNRAKLFCGKYIDLVEIKPDTSEKLVVSRLKKAKSAIVLGLKCVLTDKELHNLITGSAIQKVSNDLRLFYKLVNIFPIILHEQFKLI